MRKLIGLVIAIMLLMGCSTLNITAKDGTVLSYTSFMASTDNLKVGGTIPVTFKGAGTLDLQALLDAMKK
jgi:hypothetical protein